MSPCFPLRLRGLPVWLLLGLTPVTAHARDNDEPAAPDASATKAPAAPDDGWQFEIAPYIWTTGMAGRAATVPGLPAVDVDMSFRNIVDNLDFGIIGSATARRKRFVIAADVYYARITTNAVIPSPLFSDVDVLNETFSALVAGGYSIPVSDRITVEAMAGARYWSMKTGIDLKSPLPALSFQSEAHENWVDPIIGANASFVLSPRWSLTTGGAIGGFGIGSDLTWGLNVAASYRLSDHWRIGIGYRHLHIDYDAPNGFLFDGALSGTVIGARYSF